MTDIGTDSAGQSTSHSLSSSTPTGSSPTKLHAMSTRSSEALARRQSTHQQQPHSGPSSATGSDSRSVPLIEGRLTRKRARSINVEEANNLREHRPMHSPPVGANSSSEASTVSNSDLICICPSPPKVPRPRNAFILYRQHHQAGVVHKFPGLANPDISKIIGEHWREEDDDTKAYWKRLAEDEKARHQRQYPQYKYQPRRGGKNGGPAAARAAAAASAAGEEPGRCPKCGGRYISTPRTPSTPFGAGGMPGPPGQHGGGMGPISAAAAMHQHQQHQQQQQQQPPAFGGGGGSRGGEQGPQGMYPQQQQHHRQSIDSQHGGMGMMGGGDPRRQSSYYSHPPELRPIEEDYDLGMSRRRGSPPEDFDMVMSPDIKRRRFDSYPEQRGSPMTTVPPHRGQHQYPMMGGQAPYPQYQMQQQQHPGARRNSAVSAGGYSNHPSSAGGGNYPTAPLMHPRTPLGAPRQQQQQQQSHPPPQQPQRDMGMAPPPRPSRLSTTSHQQVPPPPPGLALPHSARDPNFDESLTLPPLKIPGSPTQTSAASDSARSLSGGEPSGLGIMSGGGPQQRGGSDSQARSIEAMVMSIPFMNKLNMLRKISPALGPPGAGSPGGEARGPVIVIEGDHTALMRDIRPVVERALRSSGECDVRVWTSAAEEQATASLSLSSPPAIVVEVGGSGLVEKSTAEDVDMADVQEKLSVASGSRHNSLSAASSSREGSKTPTPRQPAVSSSVLAPQTPSPGTSMLDYLQTIVEWHPKSAEMIQHVTIASKAEPVPVALVAGGFSLSMSDRFASRIPIVDAYSPVDHWQWMATLWRGTVGADLVVYVRRGEAGRGSVVEMHAPGVMLVRVAGERVDEKTERRLAFEVMEWVRAGSFREGYSFGNGDGMGSV